jgi:hypothetical protein
MPSCSLWISISFEAEPLIPTLFLLTAHGALLAHLSTHLLLYDRIWKKSKVLEDDLERLEMEKKLWEDKVWMIAAWEKVLFE